jgi:CheY-like chemotaxis protein
MIRRCGSQGILKVSTVLVVDDEPDLRFLIRRILERAGHDVVEASHGAAALEAVKRSPPDLVVTDMMMPVMNGSELITVLRADPDTAAIPILVVSAEAQRAVDADAVLRKPFEPNALTDMANALLEKRGSLTR